MRNWLFLSITLTSSIGMSQEIDESCVAPSKKIVKLVESAKNKPDLKTAVVEFSEAMNQAPDNAYVTYEYAMYMYNNALKLYEQNSSNAIAAGDRSLEGAKNLFHKTLEYCSDYHANCSYYLGVYYYSKKDTKEAYKWFKAFKEYKNDDNSKYPEDMDKKLNDVNEVLKEMEDQKELLSQTVPFEPKKVINVSTQSDEYFPMISPDNDLIFYTRKVNRTNLGEIKSTIVEEFTYSARPDLNALFDNGTPLTPPFNDGRFRNYGAATLAVDNKEMIICACKAEEVYGKPYLNCDLYSTTYQRTGNGANDYVWSELVNLGEEINSKDGWEGQPSLSADGNTLFYATSRPTTRDNDIYIVKRNEDGTWGKPRPFDEINTDGKDKSPFLHQDSETLYFVSSCSDTRKGAGGTDIFYTRNENGKWSTPKNIGVPINTEGDELGLFVSTDGHIAYYSSRQENNWDIYSFELYEEARPKPVTIIKGELKDDAGNPIENATIEINYSNSDEKSTIKVNGNDGKYAAVVKTEIKQDIMVTVKKENAAFDSKLITKEEIQKAEIVMKGNDLAVKELKEGESYTIHDILYATNSAELNNRSKFVLKQFANFLISNKNIVITIQGHTDDIGDDAKNLALSDARAKNVKNYLISLGVESNRLNAKGLGETMPKVENDSEENRAINRRTDFVIEKL